MFIEYLDGKKHAGRRADVSDSHEPFKDAGWVLDDNDYVIDIDDLPKETIQELINFFNIKTQIVWTPRGCHLYFKKPSNFKRGANRTSPLGFKYEIKHKGNTRSVTIKQDGELREIENFGIREEAPFVFSSNKIVTREEFESKEEAVQHRKRYCETMDYDKCPIYKRKMR